jgi:hypothetical protein
LHAWETLPSCLASSNRPTLALMPFCSCGMVGSSVFRAGSDAHHFVNIVRSNPNFYTLAPHLPSHATFILRFNVFAGFRWRFFQLRLTAFLSVRCRQLAATEEGELRSSLGQTLVGAHIGSSFSHRGRPTFLHLCSRSCGSSSVLRPAPFQTGGSMSRALEANLPRSDAGADQGLY